MAGGAIAGVCNALANVDAGGFGERYEGGGGAPGRRFVGGKGLKDGAASAGSPDKSTFCGLQRRRKIAISVSEMAGEGAGSVGM